jgi:hypothetical protein
MRKQQGFADNGACPIDPTGGETCRKEGKALLIICHAVSQIEIKAVTSSLPFAWISAFVLPCVALQSFLCQ